MTAQLSGLIDAVSYLMLGHVFVANMTGNVVFLGFALAGASGFSIAAALVALAAFALGAIAGGHLNTGWARIVAACSRPQPPSKHAWSPCPWRSPFPWRSPRPPAIRGPRFGRYVLIVLVGLATGIQNATARKLAVPDLTTTVLTLMITGIFADGRLAGGTGFRIGRRTVSALATFLGGLVGALLVLHAKAVFAITVALIILVGVALTARKAKTPPSGR
jgi:uncharacterized membrane protein YoaK (UPF0700 family)